MPPKESVLPQGPEMPPIARAIGLAITSQDPTKTQKLLMTVLQMANLVSADQQQAPPATGRYEITLGNGMKIFGNANETNKTTVLSLNSQLVEQSVTAAKTDGSVLTGGPLQDALATLSPTTSKLVVINVGAALRSPSKTPSSRPMRRPKRPNGRSTS